MNELSIAHDLLKDLQAQSERHGVSRVSRVHVRIGSLRTVVPEVLTFAFEEASQGTVAEGAELRIGVVPAKGRCDKCNADFQVDMDASTPACPQCGRIAGKLISGKELEIAVFRGRCESHPSP
jgi:hydrogenase nickel incorporation protein HypA/HybF